MTEVDQGARIGVAHLTVNFGGLRALDDVSFTLEPGAWLAVVGPNGAGKSTLINSISGLNAAYASGSIVLDGEEMIRRSARAFSKQGVARSFQDPPLIDQTSVLENVMAGGLSRFGYSLFDQFTHRRVITRLEGQAREESLRCLALFGLEDAGSVIVSELPYGLRKLVDIARALVSAPRVLLLDEPTSGLDASEQDMVARGLAEIRSQIEASLVIVEHHFEVVRSVADQVLALDAGRFQQFGPTDEVLSALASGPSIPGSSDE